MIVFILAILGLSISLYAYYVERAIAANPTYKPICDINDRISCTKALQSPYANMFFVSNSVLGILYYALIIALETIGHRLLTIPMQHALTVSLVILGALASLCLAYLLYYKIKTICLVCSSLYIVNGLLLLVTLAR